MHLKDLIEAIGRFLKKANSKEVIDEDLKASMKRMRKFLYDSADAIDDFMESENCMWDGLGAVIYKHINYRTFASKAKSISKMVENYDTTLETLRKLSTDLAKSSSACHQSVSIAFSDENDYDLVGIEKAREQLSQWLTENSSTRKVIFVHGMQGVGKTSLVGAVLRNNRVRSHFGCYVWVKDLRSCELADNKAAALLKTNAEMWDMTEEHTQLELEAVFRRLRNKNVKWVLVLDDAGSTHVFESLRSHLAQTRPSVLVTTRDSSLQYNSRTFLDSQMAQSDGAPVEPAELLYDIRNFKHLSLSWKDSCTLLCRKTFQMDGHPDYLTDAIDSIVEQCGGLPLAVLAATNLLMHLDLQDAFCDVSVMTFEKGGFQQLRFLGLDTFENLTSITVEEKALPTLERLSLGRCRNLTTVPQGMTLPEQLKCIELYEMPEAFLTAVRAVEAVHAYVKALKKLWMDGAVVECPKHATEPTTDCPKSPRQPRAGKK